MTFEMFAAKPDEPAVQLNCYSPDPSELRNLFKVGTESGIRDHRFIELRQKYANVVHELIIDTQERTIRDALIKLGWTPPSNPTD